MGKREEIRDRANQLETYFKEVLRLKAEIKAQEAIKLKVIEDTNLIKASISDEQRKYSEKCKKMKLDVEQKEKEHVQMVKDFHTSILGVKEQAAQILKSAEDEKKSIVSLRDKLAGNNVVAEERIKQLDILKKELEELRKSISEENEKVFDLRNKADITRRAANARFSEAKKKYAEALEDQKTLQIDKELFKADRIALGHAKKLHSDAVAENSAVKENIINDLASIEKEKAKIAIDKATVKLVIAENQEKKKDLDFKESLLQKLGAKLSNQQRLINEVREGKK